MMVSRISHLRRLERQFFDLLFVRLSETNQLFNLNSLDIGFLHFYNKLADHHINDLYTDLMQRIMPDPITGISVALRNNLQRFQIGGINLFDSNCLIYRVLPTKCESKEDLIKDFGINFIIKFEMAISCFARGSTV